MGKSVLETLAMIRQAFGEESVSFVRVFNGMSKLRETEKGKTGEGQRQEHAHYFL
jgi:N-acetylglucosamine-6-phosphate deacetylase